MYGLTSLVPYSRKPVTQFSTPSESVAYLRGIKNKKTESTFNINNLKLATRHLSWLISRLPGLCEKIRQVKEKADVFSWGQGFKSWLNLRNWRLI